jgi:hypothetical protein
VNEFHGKEILQYIHFPDEEGLEGEKENDIDDSTSQK